MSEITIAYISEYSSAPETKTVMADESYTLTSSDLPSLSTDGYAFLGWTIDDALISVGHTISSNITLVALWKKEIVLYDIDPTSFTYGYLVGCRLKAMRVRTIAPSESVILTSLDGYVLKDSNGIYLLAKEIY